MEIFGHRMYSKVGYHHDHISALLSRNDNEIDFEKLKIR
jgi:hypothetical protein